MRFWMLRHLSLMSEPLRLGWKGYLWRMLSHMCLVPLNSAYPRFTYSASSAVKGTRVSFFSLPVL